MDGKQGKSMNRSGYKFIDGLKERFSVSLSLVCCFVMQWFRLICFLCKTSRGVLTLQFIQERPFFVYLDLYQSIYAVCFFYEFWGQATFLCGCYMDFLIPWEFKSCC